MGPLEPSAFIPALSKLFTSTKDSGSLYIAFKKVNKRGKEATGTHLLIRARTGKKKISTTVEDSGAALFYAELSTVLDANITRLVYEEDGARGSAGLIDKSNETNIHPLTSLALRMTDGPLCVGHHNRGGKKNKKEGGKKEGAEGVTPMEVDGESSIEQSSQQKQQQQRSGKGGSSSAASKKKKKKR